MELSPRDNERLKKALIAGVALGATIATVEYIRDPEGRTRGYIYKLNRGKDWLFGVYRNKEQTEIAQISGGINDNQDIELDAPRVDPEDVNTFEEVIEIAKQSQRAI